MVQPGPAIERAETSARRLKISRKLSRIDPDDPDAQFFIGFLDAEQGHDDQAVAAFKRCLELDSLHVSAEYALSEALGHLGNAYDSQTSISNATIA